MRRQGLLAATKDWLLGLALAGPVALGMAGSAQALESVPVVNRHTTASLITDRDGLGGGSTLRIGLRLQLAAGWHTYGRDPGDAGVPPEFAFTWPAGVRASDIAWPTPSRFSENGLTTYGYTGSVVFPVTATVPAGTTSLPVTLTANWLVCEKICVPESGTFRVTLAAGPPGPSAQAALFDASVPPTAAAATAAPIPWAKALLLALLGGLILNAMPCVFPVLAMKASGLLGLAQAARSRARTEAAAYLIGSVATFCAVGGLLSALRQSGEAVGWGFQFQNPTFVAITAWVMLLVGLNLSGVFAVGGGRLPGMGQSLAGRRGLLGSFATGALAVLVATPCTAPFMGAAMATALAAPPAVTLAVFACLGAGLALPYVLLAWLPGMARLLPRPGAWMETLRQALAFPMYLTVAWLAWVLTQLAGADGVLLLGVGGVAVALAAWLLGRAQGTGRRGWAVASAVVAIATIGSATLLRPVAGAESAAGPGAASLPGGAAFSTGRLAALRAAGRPVFVDMTAAWCVTCLVNERIALAAPEVTAAFAARSVAVLRGDWTRPDPEIAAFLRQNGRDGVPLYVFYPPGGAPVLLPPLLTPGIVLQAIG